MNIGFYRLFFFEFLFMIETLEWDWKWRRYSMGSAVEYCGNFSIWGNVYVTALLNEIAFILFGKYLLCWRAVWRKGGGWRVL